MKKPITLSKMIGFILIVCGILGLIAASVLMLEKIALLNDPTYKPSCNLNPIISCGSVMETDQASAFGISNSIIGIIGFSVVTTVGFAVIAGAQFKRWFWLALQAGAILGTGFSLWLFYQGVYVIGAVCPYCALIWVVTLAMAWYLLLYNLRMGHIKMPKSLRGYAAFAQRHHGNILLIAYAVMVGLILNHFWYYWQTVL